MERIASAGANSARVAASCLRSTPQSVLPLTPAATWQRTLDEWWLRHPTLA